MFFHVFIDFFYIRTYASNVPAIRITTINLEVNYIIDDRADSDGSFITAETGRSSLTT